LKCFTDTDVGEEVDRRVDKLWRHKGTGNRRISLFPLVLQTDQRSIHSRLAKPIIAYMYS
jgi:hypothetical protein